MHVFSNNARTTLAVPLETGADNEEMVAIGDGSADSFEYLNYSPETPTDSQPFQMATLLDPSDRSVLEIVRIKGRNGVNFTVDRAQENTEARAWPAGTIVEARITAGMLRAFAQDSGNRIVRRGDDGVIRTPSSMGFVVDGRVSLPGKIIQLSGWPALQFVRASPGASTEFQDNNLSYEAVGGTPMMSLGATQTWASNAYYSPGDFVKPTVPNGFQYMFDRLITWGGTQEAVEPAFDTSGYPVDIYSGEERIGYWVPVPAPLDMVVMFSGFGQAGLMLTELGFLCTEFDQATVPSVSIGTPADPTRFVNNQPLSQIAGNAQVHRFPIGAAGGLVDQLKFKVEAPATGKFVGRFYWRGVFFQTGW